MVISVEESIGFGSPIAASGHSGCPGGPIDLDVLERDPYPILKKLRQNAPVFFVENLGCFYVSRHRDCETILKDHQHFAVGHPGMIVFDTLGVNMMTSEGNAHLRQRRAAQAPFGRTAIANDLEPAIAEIADELLRGLVRDGAGRIDFRPAFAARAPILVMLHLFRLPDANELLFRRLFDAFEAGLSNHSGDAAIALAAERAVLEFIAHLQPAIDVARSGTGDPASLLVRMVFDEWASLNDDEIARNALLVFFGGISTVEALILNTLWALGRHPDEFRKVREDLTRLPVVIEETLRWLSPAQGVQRMVTQKIAIEGVELSPGDMVNCMIGGANRDETVFDHPDTFDPDRSEVGKHLAFAAGPHRCLGRGLARVEARIALERLFTRFPDFKIVDEPECAPVGYEFRQPRKLTLELGRAV